MHLLQRGFKFEQATGSSSCCIAGVIPGILLLKFVRRTMALNVLTGILAEPLSCFPNYIMRFTFLGYTNDTKGHYHGYATTA